MDYQVKKLPFLCFMVTFSLKKPTIQFSFSSSLYFEQKGALSCLFFTDWWKRVWIHNVLNMPNDISLTY